MTTLLRAGAAFAFAAALWFLVQALFLFRRRAAMSRTDLVLMERAAERAAARRRKPVQQLRDMLKARGYEGSLTPLALVGGIASLAMTAILSLVGITGLVAYMGGVVVVIGGVVVVVWRFESTKRRRFDAQMLQCLQLLPGLLEKGLNVTDSFTQLTGTLEDPFNDEVGAALTRVMGSNTDLVTELTPVYDRYPSPAFRLLLAALEADAAAQGGQLVSAVRQAAKMLQAEASLSAEARAELASSKAQYYGLLGILGVMALLVLRAGGREATDALLGFPGIVLTAIGVVNFGVGIVRANRLFNRYGGPS